MRKRKVSIRNIRVPVQMSAIEYNQMIEQLQEAQKTDKKLSVNSYIISKVLEVRNAE